jgi:tRNA(Phe) wybutosine-synthesizing methylase Tyw3
MITNIESITWFTEEFKQDVLKDILENGIVDSDISELIAAINSIPNFITMNSCQGSLNPDVSNEHCPRTYVDFYVLNHEYRMANKLFMELTKSFGSLIRCELNYEADFDFIGENEIEDNGMINLRFGIEIHDPDVYDDMVDLIVNFNTN